MRDLLELQSRKVFESHTPESKARSRALLLPTELPDEFRVSVAVTEEDWEEALRLVQRSYVTRRLAAESDEPLYATEFHVSAPITLVQAKLGSVTVGTAGLVKDSAAGFPLEQAFAMPFLEPLRARCAEITGLAISPKVQLAG